MKTIRNHFLRFSTAFIVLGLLFSVAISSCDTNDQCEGNSLCINGVFSSTSNCTCFCLNEWQGETCDLCTLVDDDCANGFANGTDCKCECEPEWCGNDCQIEVLTCENGGAWSGFTCSCECPEGWAGAVCDSMI